MLLIVAHHYVVNSGLEKILQNTPLSERSIFFYLFGAWGKTGINCFVMITGYFMCKSKITLQKFLKLLFEVLFYNIIIYIIFVAIGYEEISLNKVLSIIPGRVLSTNFTSCFLTFYLFIPFLNILIKNLNNKQHLLLICLCLFIYTFHTTIPYTHVAMNYVSWFCVIYLIASYFRIYFTQYNKSTSFWGKSSIACLTLSILSIIAELWLHPTNVPYRYISDCNELLPTITAISSFMYFKDIKIPQSKWINIVGGSTFGVLLIHANSNTMRQWLWKDILNNIEHYNDKLFWLYPIISVISIFLICILIDRIRICFIEKPLIRLINSKIRD